MADKKGTNDVVLQISSNNEGTLDCSKDANNLELKGFENLRLRVPPYPSPDTIRVVGSPTMANPLEVSISPRSSLQRSDFSKPKSRFVEPFSSNDPRLFDEMKSNPALREGLENSAQIVPVMPLIGIPSQEEEEDEEVYKTTDLKSSQKHHKNWKVMVFVEFVLFVVFMGCLIASLTVNELQNANIWSLELWKWWVLILVIFCGRLFTEWSMKILVFLVERNFLLKKKVLYFVYGVKRSVQVFIWLGFVLLTWGLLFNHGVERSKETTRVLNYITRAIASFLVSSATWLVKTLLIKMLASSFHVTRFFDRIQESIFHHYVLQTLSGPPLMEITGRGRGTGAAGQLSLRNLKKEGEAVINKEEVVDVEKLKKMKQDKVSAGTMKGLINVIRGSSLSTISYTLDSVNIDEGEQKNEEINSEWEAKAAAYRIFRNVAKPGYKYIEEEDLLRFVKEEEVNNVVSLFQGAAETRQIKRSALKTWLVNIYSERKSLVHSLNDTKTAIEELNRLASLLVLVVIVIVWLLMMGFLTTQVLLLITSQFLLLIFVFGETAKNVFEAIIFVFVMHPFDVGDRCVIDGEHMIVEEMNILTTVFLRSDNEKILYPNSVLAKKPIGNFNRSPEMSDYVEFWVDISTSVEQIGALKDRIKTYLENKPQHWRPGFSVTVKEIENVNKMKMGLSVNHTTNFQNYGDKCSRMSDLVLELKKAFEELRIQFHLLPQEVSRSYIGSPAASR